MKSEEIIYQNVYVSPRPPPTISHKDSCMCDLDSDIAGSSKDIQRIEPKPKTQWSSTERPVCGEKEEIEERTKFGRDPCGGVLFGYDIKEVEGVRQQEEQEDERDEEIGSEVNGEVEEVTHRAHETWGWRWDEWRLKLEPAWAGQCACIYQGRQSKDND